MHKINLYFNTFLLCFLLSHQFIHKYHCERIGLILPPVSYDALQDYEKLAGDFFTKSRDIKTNIVTTASTKTKFWLEHSSLSINEALSESRMELMRCFHECLEYLKTKYNGFPEIFGIEQMRNQYNIYKQNLNNLKEKRRSYLIEKSLIQRQQISYRLIGKMVRKYLDRRRVRNRCNVLS